MTDDDPVGSVLSAWRVKGRAEAEKRYARKFRRSITDRKIDEELADLVNELDGKVRSGDDVVAVPVSLLLAIALRPRQGRAGHPADTTFVRRHKWLQLDWVRDRKKELEAANPEWSSDKIKELAAKDATAKYPYAGLTPNELVKRITQPKKFPGARELRKQVRGS